MLRFLKDFKPDELIIGGDLLDLESVSSHNAGKLRQISASNVKRDFDSGRRLLDDYQKYAPKITYLEGNHEYRVKRYIDANPQFAGLLEVPEQLELAARKIYWIPCWEFQNRIYCIGKAGFIHGVSHATDHAKIMSSLFDMNIFYGHTHDINCFGRAFAGEKHQRIAQSLGCLCKYDQHYLRGRPTNWQQGFGVFYFRDDGFFNYNVVQIFNSKFFFEKNLYDGKKS